MEKNPRPCKVGNVNPELEKTQLPKTKTNHMDWGSMEWLVDDSIEPGADMSVAIMRVLPGEKAPDHSHPNCHEFLYLALGSIEQTIGQEKKVLKAGDSVFIPVGTIHGSRNIGTDEAKIIVSYSAGIRKYESA